MIERYTLPEIGRIWEDENRFRIWLEIETLASEAQAKLGIVPREAVEEIRAKGDFSVERILEIEAEIHHDVIAFLTNVAEHVGPSARYVHFGMTSSDVLDTALAVQMKQAAELILGKLDAVIVVLRRRALEFKDAVTVGRSHGVHAEPTTFGLKILTWYSEMLRNRERLLSAIATVSYGKISGAVGTFAHMDPFVEEYVCEKLELKPAEISTQILQRDRHAEYMGTLAVIAATLEKISLEVRHLQRTEVLEVEEPFGSKQKGSSAMPHKKNPILSERLCGMARLLRGNLVAALENVALWHERDISHSSVERVIIPDSTITLYYMLEKTRFMVDGMVVNTDRMQANLDASKGLVLSQSVLLKLVMSGVSREDAYRLVQRNALKVYHGDKTLLDELLQDDEVLSNLSEEELRETCNLQNSLQNVSVAYKRLGLI